MCNLILHVYSKKSTFTFSPFYIASHVISKFCTSSFARYPKIECKGLDKALRILDLIVPKVRKVEDDGCHHRLIHGYMKGLLEFGIENGCEVGRNTAQVIPEEESAQMQVDNAYLVFETMPLMNTVSWTAIIAGYARDWQVETCLHHFSLMRTSMVEPNDFTFASLLSACTNCASLGLGRCVQSLEIKMGFDLYIHVSNALISMYAKCGSVNEARYIFDNMLHRDLISWNSIIFGYAQSGLAEKALDLLKDMDNIGAKPDAITFLGILSSCRHAGLIDQGWKCFNMMLEQGIQPELDHYSCITDLLGRVGLLKEALNFIRRMPIPPNAVIWGSLLSSCRIHGNVRIGIQAAECRLLLEPGCAATHVQLANLYASVGCWDRVAEVRKLMKERKLKSSPGYSWIEITNTVCRFQAEDRSNALVKEILPFLDSLECHMKPLDCNLVANSDLNDREINL